MIFDLLSRVTTISLERHWIDYLGFLIAQHFPLYSRNTLLGELVHILTITIVMMAVVELFESIGKRRANKTASLSWSLNR